MFCTATAIIQLDLHYDMASISLCLSPCQRLLSSCNPVSSAAKAAVAISMLQQQKQPLRQAKPKLTCNSCRQLDKRRRKRKEEANEGCAISLKCQLQQRLKDTKQFLLLLLLLFSCPARCKNYLCVRVLHKVK